VGWILLFVLSVAVAEGLGLDEKLLARIHQIYGIEAGQRAVRWNALMSENKEMADSEKLESVNQFFNSMQFVSDWEHWDQEDYWATPIEFLGTNGGDCEDFAVAKYFTLRELGVPEDRLRLTYVKALELNQAHMVLTYFVAPDAEPLVLDSLINEIKPASSRSDLRPVYSFNGDSLWLAKERGRGQLVGGSGRLSRWVDVVGRVKSAAMRTPLN